MPGMTSGEVEGILGGGPDAFKGPRAVPRTAVWLGSDGICIVQFGPDGRVQSAEFKPRPVSPVDRLRVRAAQRLQSLHD